MKTKRKTPPISRFPAIACLFSRSDSIVRDLILLAKSAMGCRGAEWIENPWLTKMPRMLNVDDNILSIYI